MQAPNVRAALAHKKGDGLRRHRNLDRQAFRKLRESGCSSRWHVCRRDGDGDGNDDRDREGIKGVASTDGTKFA